MEQRKRIGWFNPRNWSFASRLTVIMISLVLLTLAGITYVTVTTVRDRLEEQISKSFLLQAKDLGGLVAGFFQENGTQLQVIAASQILQNVLTERNASYKGNQTEIENEILAVDKVWLTAADDDPLIVRTTSDDPTINPIGHELSQFLTTFPTHTEVFVTDRYGATVAATGRLSDYYQADEDWWQATWNEGEGAVFISQPELDESAGVTAVLIGVPVYDDNDEVVGVLRSTLILNDLDALIKGRQDDETGQYALLFLPSFQPLFDPYAGSDRDSTKLPEKLRKHLATRDQHDMVSEDQSGVPAVYGHLLVKVESETDESSRSPEAQLAAAINNLNWATVVRQDTSEAFAAVNDIVQWIIVVALITIVAGVVVAIVVARTVTRPLVRLSTAAEQIGLGDLNAPLPSIGNDEVGRLTASIAGMTAQLRDLIGSLEHRVATRTQRLETVASLTEYLTGILDFDRLLGELVNQVKEAFDYYHVHIYIINNNQQRLVMAAGAGEVGIQMKTRGHYISINARSLVARVARTGAIVTVNNVREAEDWLPNPLLPDTHSEMAVPIFLEGQVVGVLDVQEDKVAGFDEGDTSVLRSLANQVAVAIRNARLFADVEAALVEAYELQRRYVEHTWDRSQVTKHGAGRVKFSLGESTTLNEATIAEARLQALAHQEPGLVTLNHRQDKQAPNQPDDQSEIKDDLPVQVSSNATSQAWVAPILLRDVPIGNLQLHEVDPNKEWTDSELALIDAVIDQVTQTAENLRLIDEAQERASRERLIGQISDKLRSAPDIETLMKIGVEEMSRVLKSTRTFVRFGVEVKSEDTSASIPDNSTRDTPVQDDEDLTVLAKIDLPHGNAPPNGHGDERI